MPLGWSPRGFFYVVCLASASRVAVLTATRISFILFGHCLVNLDFGVFIFWLASIKIRLKNASQNQAVKQ
jgi:hypothetical protein